MNPLHLSFLLTENRKFMRTRRLLLGITGSVAVYKAAYLVRLCLKAGYEVEVVMTEAATRFVSPLTFQALTGKPVIYSLWDDYTHNAMGHIELSRRADLMLIAPASANMLAKLAQGICDDLISSLAAARHCALAVAPAMNRQMWLNPANLRNIEQLHEDGIAVFGPEDGEQACGEIGTGRLLEPEIILELLNGLTQPKLLAGKTVTITAGPTVEHIDPVRALTNLSSGKMGYELARACRDAGAQVTLISGPCTQPIPTGIDFIAVTSALEMHAAVMSSVAGKDLFISVAAVADYRVTQPSMEKIKKDGTAPTLSLVENPDILADVAALPNPPFCVGFAAETSHVLENARVKRQRKKVPLLVANRFDDAMGRPDNQVVLIDDHGEYSLPEAPKEEIAIAIVKHISQLMHEVKR